MNAWLRADGRLDASDHSEVFLCLIGGWQPVRKLRSSLQGGMEVRNSCAVFLDGHEWACRVDGMREPNVPPAILSDGRGHEELKQRECLPSGRDGSPVNVTQVPVTLLP